MKLIKYIVAMSLFFSINAMADNPHNNVGAPGPAGPMGPSGPMGPVGPIGLTGPVGDTGAMGASGAKGDKGDKGDPGIPGLNGINGTNGAAGKDADMGLLNGLSANQVKLRGGIALGLAAASHVYDVTYSGIQASIAGGHFDGQNAISVGLGGKLNSRVFISMNVGKVTEGSTGFGVGIGFKF